MINAMVQEQLNGAGVSSLSQLARDVGRSPSAISNLFNGRASPIGADGSIKQIVHEICERLGCLPEDIFSEDQMLIECDPDMVGNDKLNESLDDSVGREMLVDYVANLLYSLTDREAEMLSMRFGLGSNPRTTFADMGFHFSYSRNRVIEIEARAMDRLRAHKDINSLAGYLQ
jgi:RNA polymerase primary sigma factor